MSMIIHRILPATARKNLRALFFLTAITGPVLAGEAPLFGAADWQASPTDPVGFCGQGNNWYPGATPPIEWWEGKPTTITGKVTPRGGMHCVYTEEAKRLTAYADSVAKNIRFKVSSACIGVVDCLVGEVVCLADLQDQILNLPAGGSAAVDLLLAFGNYRGAAKRVRRQAISTLAGGWTPTDARQRTEKLLAKAPVIDPRWRDNPRAQELLAHSVAQLNSLFVRDPEGLLGDRAVPLQSKHLLAAAFHWDTAFTCTAARFFAPDLCQGAISAFCAHPTARGSLPGTVSSTHITGEGQAPLFPEQGCFLDATIADGTPFSGVINPNMFLPLWAGVPLPADDIQRCLKTYLLDPQRFWRPMPFPSLSYDHPKFTPREMPTSYWRGRIWPHVGYWMVQTLQRHGFIAEAEQAAVWLVDMLCLSPWPRENYHTDALYRQEHPPGDGDGISDYNWSLATAINLLSGSWRRPLLES